MRRRSVSPDRHRGVRITYGRCRLGRRSMEIQARDFEAGGGNKTLGLGGSKGAPPNQTSCSSALLAESRYGEAVTWWWWPRASSRRNRKDGCLGRD
jgi:hypothetical protein